MFRLRQRDRCTQSFVGDLRYGCTCNGTSSRWSCSQGQGICGTNCGTKSCATNHDSACPGGDWEFRCIRACNRLKSFQIAFKCTDFLNNTILSVWVCDSVSTENIRICIAFNINEYCCSRAADNQPIEKVAIDFKLLHWNMLSMKYKRIFSMYLLVYNIK